MIDNEKNSLFRVLAVLEAKDESRQHLLNILLSLLKPAREEEGNISYDLYCSTLNPNEFLLDELWYTKGDFVRHYESPKSYIDRERVNSLMNRPLHISTYIEINESDI
ncbi:MAG TPA: antibiotic biosynthesis monooxygenase family protein [Candidatus Saccharimonadales bacterium]|nr:antibiotic biosynthesis monooxygenase family protein [Candidatus Saccharimonadales bacterium]